MAMPKAYSMDLRQRVIEARDRGDTIAEAAARLAVSDSFVEKLTRRRESGTLALRAPPERLQAADACAVAGAT
jgi:transposase